MPVQRSPEEATDGVVPFGIGLLTDVGEPGPATVGTSYGTWTSVQTRVTTEPGKPDRVTSDADTDTRDDRDTGPQ